MANRFRRALALGVVTIGALASGASAQTGPDLLLGTFGEGHNAVVTGDAYVMDKGSTSNDASDRLAIFNTSGRFKLDLDTVIKGVNRTQPRAGYSLTHIDTNSNDPRLPDQMTDMSVGIGVGIAKTDKLQAGLSVAVGYAATGVFGDGDGYYGKADLAVGYQLSDTEKVGFVLDYNGNRTFMPDTPLPGFIYTRKLNEQVTLEVGFPYSDIEYKPSERLTLLLKFLFPDGGEANVDYAVTPAFHVYGGLQSETEAFHWDELPRGDDRVLFFQTRAEVGVRGEYGALDQAGVNASFIAAVGYAFGTRFQEGFDSRDTEKLADVGDEPYLRVGFEVKF